MRIIGLETGIIGLPSSGSSGSGLLTDLISWWSMDEASGNMLDSHGTNDMTAEGTVGSAVGVVSNCRTFSNANNSGGYVTSSDFYWTGNGISVAFWLYLESSTVLNIPILSYASAAGYGTNSATTQWRFFWDGTNISFAVNNNSTFGTVSKAVSTSTWVHLVGTYDPSTTTVSLYLNNGTPATVSFTAAAETSADTLRIANAASFQQNMRADEVAVWDRALTADDVSTLYNSGTGKAYADL